MTREELIEIISKVEQLRVTRCAIVEVTRLREALRNISLASQNSMSSKEECGSLARRAMEGK